MRLIHPDLLEDMKSHCTTLCDIAIIGPMPDGSYRCLSGLDKDVVYDPNTGVGPRTFKARTGFKMAAVSSTADLGVDNTEAQTLIPIASYELEGITQAEIDNGVLDNVEIAVYTVNYENLSAGRHGVAFGGTIGEVRTQYGMITVPELRGLSQQLKQPIGDYDSKDCRAVFGSQPIGTGTGVHEELYPCGFDAEALWVESTVTAVGSAPDILFTDSSLVGAQTADYYSPGVVRAIDGANAGAEREIESYDPVTGAILLQFPFAHPMAPGDQYKLRPDCTHTPDGCRRFWLVDWVNHYRGEPAIPTADAGKLNTPGAALSGGPTGSGEAT